MASSDSEKDRIQQDSKDGGQVTPPHREYIEFDKKAEKKLIRKIDARL